jgi:hypothetical protein
MKAANGIVTLAKEAESESVQPSRPSTTRLSANRLPLVQKFVHSAIDERPAVLYLAG